MIVYPVVASAQRLVFTTRVLNHLAKHRQTCWWNLEAGGQLFARFDLPDIIIDTVTGPRRSDWRTRFSYQPDRRAEQCEIDLQRRKGLHFIGDWHTHPEPIPSPSARDSESMRELFAQSGHTLNGFVLAIVGRKSFPCGLSVWLYNSADAVQLRPLCLSY